MYMYILPSEFVKLQKLVSRFSFDHIGAKEKLTKEKRR